MGRNYSFSQKKYFLTHAGILGSQCVCVIQYTGHRDIREEMTLQGPSLASHVEQPLHNSAQLSEGCSAASVTCGSHRRYALGAHLLGGRLIIRLVPGTANT